MRVLVTGGGGQLAEACEALDGTDGHSVVAASPAELDVTDRSMVRERLKVEGPDVVVNAAAYTAVDEAEEEEVTATRVNGEAAGIIAEACHDSKIRMVQISTDFVFGRDAREPIRPDANPDPVSAYGRSKLLGERRVQEILGDDALIVRTAWLYASGHRNFVSTMLGLMRTRGEIRVVSDQIGTPTWVDTLARCVLRLAHDERSGMQHVTDSGVGSWYDFAIAIHDIGLEVGLLERSCDIEPIRTSEFPTPAERPSYSVLDKTQSFRLLGGSTPHWRRSLRRCLSEWRESNS